MAKIAAVAPPVTDPRGFPSMAVYVATHKRAALPRGDWLTPIGLNGYRDENVRICDADGADNIAHLNRSYGELTGLHWLLKHCRDDYVGLCHYRRFLTFTPPPAPDINYPAVFPMDTTDETFDYLASDEQKTRMLSLLDTYDFIVPRPIIYAETVATSFVNAHGELFWDRFLRSCQREFGHDVSYFDLETRFYCGNIFVTTPEKFRQFAKSLFRVVDHVYEELGEIEDMPEVRYAPHRYPGYIADRFMGLYIHKMGLRVFEAPMVWLN